MILDPADPRFAEAGMHVAVGETGATLHDLDAAGNPRDRWHACVTVADGKLVFYPTRSAAQRRALARIGIAVPERPV